MQNNPISCSPEHNGKHAPGTSVARRRISSPAALALLVPALIVGGVSCATGGAQDPLSAAEAREGRSNLTGGMITAQDVRALSVGNLYEVVLRLRPLWLRPRSGRTRFGGGPEIMVVQNGMYFGPVESLRELTTENIFSISYLDGAAATATYSYPGVQPHIDGAIVVEWGSGPRNPNR